MYRDSQTRHSTNPVLFQTDCRLTYLIISGYVHLDVPGSSLKMNIFRTEAIVFLFFHKLFLLPCLPQSVAHSLYSVTQAGNHPIEEALLSSSLHIQSTSKICKLILLLNPSCSCNLGNISLWFIHFRFCSSLPSCLGGIPLGSTTLLQPASFPTFKIKRNSLLPFKKKISFVMQLYHSLQGYLYCQTNLLYVEGMSGISK